MIYFIMFLLGGILGIALWFYLSGFYYAFAAKRFMRLTLNYFHKTVLHFNRTLPLFNKKSAVIFNYFFSIGVGYILQIAFQDSIFTVWIGLTLIILWTISYLDWHYHLISTTPCLWLLTLGLFGADNNFSLLTLSESIKSAASFLLFSTQSIGLQNVITEKKPLDRERLLASNGIRKFYSFRNLTALFIISLSAWNMFSLIHKRKKNFIPFAPLYELISCHHLFHQILRILKSL